MAELPTAGVCPRTLPDHLVAFARRLRSAGLPVSPAEVIDLCRALELIDIAQHHEVRAAARATLVRAREQLPVFEAVFDAYWLHHPQSPQPPAPADPAQHAAAAAPAGGEQERDLLLDGGSDDADDASTHPRDAELVTASAIDVLAHRDIGSLDAHELQLARSRVRELVRGLANRPGHRHRRHARRGDVDLRHSLRRAQRHGFETIEIVRRERRITRLRLLLLCDISGSMARYSAFFLAFVQALRDELPALEAAVFATRLTPVTELLHRGDPVRSLAGLQNAVRGWGGGTDIGRALGEFNERFAQRMVRTRTVVVILSDGWDRGDPAAMRDAMTGLRRWADTLVWLNPLLGHDGYQPLCRGMRTALPYLDHFLPAHDLASLAAVAARLRGL